MLHLDIRQYCRPFRQPLQTAHGRWVQREGWILRCEDAQQRVSFGEVAPMPWFGTETWVQAQAFCDRFPRHFSPQHLGAIPDTLPACQFGFSAASPPVAAALFRQPQTETSQPPRDCPPADICALLPAGSAALGCWQALWEQGHRTFKWKIGVAAIEEELSIFQQLIAVLPGATTLRLDANGGLTPDAAVSWLLACDAVSPKIEFLEQPLSPAFLLNWLPQIQGQFETAIALDESVATLAQLRHVYRQVGNQVVYVVKPAIAGLPQQLMAFCLRHHLDVVFSSALETPVGRNLVFALAQRLWAEGTPKRALGFGVGHWFEDDWEHFSEAELWQRL